MTTTADVKAQMRASKARMKRNELPWEAHDKKMNPIIELFLHRNRTALMISQARAAVVMENVPVGSSLEKWREYNKSANTVTRVIADFALSSRKAFTVSDIEAALPRPDGRPYLSRKSLTSIINRGVDLGLLKRGEHQNFLMTELMMDEFFHRCIWRSLAPEIYAYAKYVVALHEMCALEQLQDNVINQQPMYNTTAGIVTESLYGNLYDEWMQSDD